MFPIASSNGGSLEKSNIHFDVYGLKQHENGKDIYDFNSNTAYCSYGKYSYSKSQVCSRHTLHKYVSNVTKREDMAPILSHRPVDILRFVVNEQSEMFDAWNFVTTSYSPPYWIGNMEIRRSCKNYNKNAHNGNVDIIYYGHRILIAIKVSDMFNDTKAKGVWDVLDDLHSKKDSLQKNINFMNFLTNECKISVDGKPTLTVTLPQASNIIDAISKDRENVIPVEIWLYGKIAFPPSPISDQYAIMALDLLYQCQRVKKQSISDFPEITFPPENNNCSFKDIIQQIILMSSKIGQIAHKSDDDQINHDDYETALLSFYSLVLLLNVNFRRHLYSIFRREANVKLENIDSNMTDAIKSTLKNISTLTLTNNVTKL